MSTPARACSLDGCKKVQYCGGYCRAHYERWRRHGDPNKVLKSMSPRGAPMDWLIAHSSHKSEECLAWPFSKHPSGRAHMKAGKPARIMCELANGPAPSPRHHAAHSCGRAHEACVNPQHLRWATPKENAADKIKHGTLLKGSGLPQSRLTETEVRIIRRRARFESQTSLSEKFGVGLTCINKIVHMKSWRHVQ